MRPFISVTNKEGLSILKKDVVMLIGNNNKNKQNYSNSFQLCSQGALDLENWKS